MEIIKTKKINVSELKEKLNDALIKSMKDRAYMCIQKEDAKDVIDVLEYLENMDVKEQEESKKYCFGCYWVSITCMLCNMSELCKQASKNKGISDEKVN